MKQEKPKKQLKKEIIKVHSKKYLKNKQKNE